MFLSQSCPCAFAKENRDYYITDEAGKHFNLGLDFQDKGNHTLAVSEFETAIRLRPNFPRAYLNLGNSWVKLGKTENAIPAYEKALYYDPSYEKAYFALSLACNDTRNRKCAIDNFRKVLALNFDNNYARHNLWEIYVDLKQYENAGNLYREFLEKKPWDAYARLKLAYTYWLEGRHKTAVKEAIKIFNYLNPGR